MLNKPNPIHQAHTYAQQVHITLFYNDDLDLWDLGINGAWHPGVSGIVAGSLIELAMMCVEVAPQEQVTWQDCDCSFSTVTPQ